MYKKGDKVRVRADLEEGKEYGGLTLFRGAMADCRGEVGTVIRSIDRNAIVSIPSVNCNFAFSNEMLEPVPSLAEIKEENKPMKEFGKVEGIRIDKTCNKKVEIVTTYASCPHGHATTVCDKVNYDAYMGALVAAAKITALKSNDAMRLYKLAINMWDDAMIIPDSTVAILKTLADEAFDGGFENAYKKWQRQIKAEEKAQTEKELRCSVCGKKFDTPEDARKHEQWHTDKKEAKKQRYLERCEAKKRIAEAERESRIKAYMDELAKDKK